MQSGLFGDDLQKLFPVIEEHCSDSGNFDNAMEFLYHTGRTLQEVAMMMIPEAWQTHHSMPEDKRAFYEYHSALQEPWDGPASISFTDGKYIGACLDRNGLRPSRYYVTHDDKVVMASEVGVLDIVPENVKLKGCPRRAVGLGRCSRLVPHGLRCGLRTWQENGKKRCQVSFSDTLSALRGRPCGRRVVSSPSRVEKGTFYVC